MLKILTIIFFVYYLSVLISQNKKLKEVTTKYLSESKEKIIKNNSTKTQKSNDLSYNDFVLILLTIGIFILYFIELLYIAFSIKYDPYQYVIVGYFIYWVLMFIKSGVTQKKYNLKAENMEVEEALKYLDKLIIKINKITIWGIIQNVIDIGFYIFMIYIFFIR